MLALAEYYLPGYKAGGPITTLSGMVERLGGEVEFSLITRDRDYTDQAPYSGIEPGVWQPAGGARVMYLSPAMLRPAPLARLLRATGHEVLYLNSLFSPCFTVLPLVLRRLGLAPRRGLIVAPRGELGGGALSAKAWKKRPYLLAARALGLYAGARWQASSPFEAEQIRAFAPRSEVLVAPDLPPPPPPAGGEPPRRPKQAGRLRAVFLARLGRHKNLSYALTRLAEAGGPAELTIAGPREDPAYWQQCQAQIGRLPPGVGASYRGRVEPGQVPALLAGHDVLILPSKGENFGHVILEALLAGTPVLISDATPWRGLETAGAGWDLPLDQPQRFTSVLRRLRDMDDDEHTRLSRAARALGRRAAESPEALAANRRLFSGW